MERAEIAELFYNALINLNDLENQNQFRYFEEPEHRIGRYVNQGKR
jgi:hypothetical protein